MQVQQAIWKRQKGVGDSDEVVNMQEKKKPKRGEIEMVTIHASTAGNLEETKGRRRQ